MEFDRCTINARNDYISLIAAGTMDEEALDEQFQKLYVEEQELNARLKELEESNKIDNNKRDRITQALKNILEKCKEMEIPIHIVTNGYDLHHYIDILKQYNIASMQITLDGLKDDHDSRRFLVGGKGSYDRIVQNIGLALEAGVPITLRTNVNKKNLESIIDLVNDYNMREWVKYPNFRYYFKSTLRCYEEIGDALSDVELMAKVHELFGTDAGRFHFNSIYGTLSDRIEYMLRTGSFAPLRSGFCGANTNMYTINPFGDIYPCWDVLSEEESGRSVLPGNVPCDLLDCQ